jgi:acyl-homoserine-lactone acylase
MSISLPGRSAVSALLAVALTFAFAAACGDNDPAPGPKDADAGGEGVVDPPEPFRATVRRTSAGVPHVKADDFGGVGYGYGYVFAEDNLCLLAEEILTVRGERARYFGDVPYDLGNTSSQSNVNSDAFYKMLFTKAVADRYRDAQSEELRAMVRGYAAGVSRYVRELQGGGHEGRHGACRGEAWVREITDEDLYLRYYKLNLVASTGAFIDAVAAARPPTAKRAPAPQSARPPAPPVPSAAAVKEGLAQVAPKLIARRDGDIGSNMYAFGRETTGGGGIQFGNPHFPWYGGERLYQVHLTVPGKMDVQGASLYGVPIVLIGFTNEVAWSHTVSTAHRFTPYKLKLVGDPMVYEKDGAEKAIEEVPIEVAVRQANGEITSQTVTLYRSEYGPMVYLGNPAFDWTLDQAFTIRDANTENVRLFRNYFRWNQAKSLEEFARIQREEVAVPWVNTTAADREGNAYYADITVVPNVPDEMARACADPILSRPIDNAVPGLPLLDGSRSECDWRTDPDAPQPGIFGPGNLPSVMRKDYVVNCNDSYWLTHPEAKITGFARIIGREDYEQTLRSRLCHHMVRDRLAGTDGLAGQGVTPANLKEMVLGARVYSAEIFRQAALDAFCQEPTITLTRDPLRTEDQTPPIEVPVADACTALEAWDGRNNLESRGSLLWDEFWFRVLAVRANASVFDAPFSAADPLNTPAELKTSEPRLQQAFAAAVHSVKQAGFAVDEPRSSITYFAGKDGEKIAIPGGFQSTGSFAIAQTPNPVLKSGEAYGPVRYGNSYLQIVAFTAEGVDASTLVTYSQSTDPTSPHFDDYTRLYAEKAWLKAVFTEAEVAADTKSTVTLEQ